MTGPVSPRAYVQLLRTNRNARLLLTAQIISEAGDWFYTLMIFSLLLQWTGSARMVALAGVMALLPQALVGPLAGAVNDRLPRQRVMIATDLIRAVIVLTMMLAVVWKSPALLFLLMFLETVSWAFFEPGRSALIPNLVHTKEEAMVANALSSTIWSAGLALGSALGGWVGAAIGPHGVFVLNSLSFLVSALLLSCMHVQEPHTLAYGPLRLADLVNFQPIADGFRYVTRDRRLLGTVLLKGALGLLAVHLVLLPLLGQRVFPVERPGQTEAQAGLLAMGLLMGARGVGAIIGPILASWWAGASPVRLRLGIAGGFFAFSTGWLVLAGAQRLDVAMLALLVAYAGSGVVWVFSTSLIQFMTEDAFRGRVFSTEFACFTVLMSTVTFVAGVLVDRQVPLATLCLAVSGLALVPALLWLWAQRLWR